MKVVQLVLILIFTDLFTSVAASEGSKALRNCCGPGCRQRSETVGYYDETYFKWQNELAATTRKGHRDAHIRKFEIPDDATAVADFGAGGGHILGSLPPRFERWAVDVNPHARKFAEEKYGLKAVEYPEDLPDDYFDVIFSTSAIEHMECPLQELRELYKKVKPGGTIFVAVKNEGPSVFTEYTANDVHHHLWTWTKQLLGNVLIDAGFNVTRIDPPANIIDQHLQRCKRTGFNSGECMVYLQGRAKKLQP